MKSLFLILATSCCLMLSGCNDDNDSDSSQTPNPPVSNCKMHCAP
ncbi:hypothetical protein [Acinetobacter sp. R933-2]|nr:hypothetical protein [Acinetobacter sp. R933-2]